MLQVACLEKKIWSVEELETYIRAQAKDITLSITQRREVEKDEALSDFPWNNERTRKDHIVYQINIGSVSKVMLEKHLRDEVECMIVGSSEHIDMLSWTELWVGYDSYEREREREKEWQFFKSPDLLNLV